MSPIESTKQRILLEASALLQETGLGGFSMRKLAARLGLSATALYRHYADKEQLISAACAEGFDRFGAALWRALDEPSDWERLVRTGQEYLRFALEHPDFYRVMFMMPTDLLGWKAIPEPSQRRIHRTFEFLMDRVRAASRTRRFRWTDERTISASIWAHCHGLVALRLDGHMNELSDAEFAAFYAESTHAHLMGLLDDRDS